MIINATPHVINFYDQVDTSYSSELRKLVVNNTWIYPVYNLQPSGLLLNATSIEEDAEPINPDEFFSIPTKNIEYKVDYETVNSIDMDKFYVVSALFVSAMRATGCKTHNLLTVGGTVYSNTVDPKPVGCLYLIRN